jgi:quinone-modifying oxidoreductase subunit QmoB
MFGPDALVERVNIREGVAWVSEPKSAETQNLAEDYLKIGLVKAQKTSFPEPFIKELEKTVLVVGGGIAGMTSALAVAKTGRNAVLVEKEKTLGGYLRKLKKRFPTSGETDAPVETGITETVRATMNEPRIKVHTDAVVESISGQPGLFDVVISSGGAKIQLRVGAVIQATGFKPYDAEKLGHLGYGKTPNVVTNAQFEEMAAKGKIVRPSDGKPARSVVFIQCAGSRDKNHLPYCSSFCCMTSLKQAAYLREADPSARAYIFYKDMRTPGKYERFYKKMQDDDGLFMTKAEISAVVAEPDGTVTVSATNTLLGEDINVAADLVVLAAGIEPNAPDALHLKYRQGPDLPSLNYGFPDSHFICFPYETRRTGIYATGAVRHPMDAAFAEIDAGGAALKAIQCVELAAKGKSAHPRSGDTSYPEIAFERCTQCKRCTEECPYGMYDEDEKGTPLPNPLRCRRCGTCMGACPQRIISFKDYHVDMVSSMIRAITVPQEEKLRVLVFVCENDAMPAFDMAGLSKMRLDSSIRVIPLRCLGSINLVWLSDAFSKGIDGVLMLGCPYGDDYQCHNMKGSELAKERSGKLEETLGRMMLEPERVRLEQLSINEYHKLPKLIGDFVARMEELGPNPFKEFGDN